MSLLGVFAFCGLCLANALVALWVLLRPAAGPVDARRIGKAALAVAGVTLAEVVLFQGRGLTLGGVLHIAWLDLVLVLPFAGLGLLLAAHEGLAVSPGARRVAWASLAVVPLAAYAQFVEPFDVRLERATVRLDTTRAGTEPITVGVLSDVQMMRVTDHERDAVRRLMAEEPDVILLPGDIFQGSETAFRQALPDIQQLLALLGAPGGVWIVPGDSDRRQLFDAVTLGTAAQILRDEVVRVTVRDRELTILGLDSPDFELRRSLPELTAFEQAPGATDVRLVVCHRPGAVELLQPDTRVDLLVAGHTHGGQVALPFIGPLVVGSPLPHSVAAGGLHELDGRRLYISRGLGMKRDQAPQIRFLAPPEISLITLR